MVPEKNKKTGADPNQIRPYSNLRKKQWEYLLDIFEKGAIRKSLVYHQLKVLGNQALAVGKKNPPPHGFIASIMYPDNPRKMNG